MELNILKTTKQLNILTLPLQGNICIESAAGTGKTHNIVLIYLRLLLQLGNQTIYLRPLSVKEILVVTFTDAATRELRSRIRENIHKMRLACIRGKSNDPLLSVLLTQITDFQLATTKLIIAEQQMEEAAIFTIHSFCQRILNFNTIESDVYFQYTLIKNEKQLQKQVIADFWRRYCYPLPLEIARIVNQYWTGPEYLLAELLPYLQGEQPVIQNIDTNKGIIEQHKVNIRNIKDLKQQWRKIASEIPIILKKYKLNNRVYNKRNLTTWLTKVNEWVTQPTIDYQVPDELERFSSITLAEKIITGNPPHHEIFTAVQNFYQNRFSLRELIFIMALTEARQSLKQEKQYRAELGFDDLLSHLDQALTGTNGERLAKSIRINYPIAIIDEFQDTDPQQYRIFQLIYSNALNCSLLMIGDPKQAIYAFRGADIFTYINARNKVKAHYILNTNWRSAPGMINAINKLFQNLPVPFIFKEITFSPVVAAKDKAYLRLLIHQKLQPGLCIWLQTGDDGVGINEYYQYMAKQCAATISNWLNAARKKEAWLNGHHGQQELQASDIAVLVRNRSEAELMRNALKTLMIKSVYLSNRDSVFETIEAHELQWILQAVLLPENNNMLRSALATNLLGFNASDIDELNNNELKWEQLVKEFTKYHQCWQENGVLPMIRQIITNHCIAKNILADNNGERQLTNILHLGELLQEASIQLKNKHTLINWLKQQIKSPDPQETNQQLRLESDQHLVQIITIHKSKGLEFPIVFLPFAAYFNSKKQLLFHDRETYQTKLNLNLSRENLKLADEERLAEDMRLLYVAVTRSIYHCSIGVAPLYYYNNRNKRTTDLHLSAIGYLIQQGKAGDSKYLREQLIALTKQAIDDIALCEKQVIAIKQFKPPKVVTIQALSSRDLPTLPCDYWRISSYSELKPRNSSVAIKSLPKLNLDNVEVKKQKNTSDLTPHDFPRGAKTGIFLHKILKTMDFNCLLEPKWLSLQLEYQNIDTIWHRVIMNWIKKIITIPLDNKSLSLTNLTPDNRRAELQFYLSINTLTQASDLDQLCKRYDPLSALCKPLHFTQIKGILKGFIDLVFRWQGRYYILDYKSNWLGEEDADYIEPVIWQAMITHRYDLQYQIYTLALHRYLRHRLLDYYYPRDFGGVYYLFLRGINQKQPRNSVFYCRPNINLINELDTLFTG